MTKYRGVNLGGWLVLERWMAPSLFADMQAQDEHSWLLEKGASAAAELDKHRRSYITESDIAWIATRGLNAVRLPIPYWLFADEGPFVACVEYVDWLMDVTAQHNISVMLDLHAAPGSQNGWDHSGRAGEIGWTQDKNMQQTLDVLERIAKRYGHLPHLIGIELLNEPHFTLDIALLQDFYDQGIAAVRRHAHEARVVISDAFRPLQWDKKWLASQRNVALDMHLYQAFDDADKGLDMRGHLDKTRHEWAELVQDMGQHIPVIIGEWSLGLEPSTQSLDTRAYAKAQLNTFDGSLGWFFWNYKTENMAGWSYRAAVERDWL